MKRLLLVLLGCFLIICLTGCASLHPVDVTVKGHKQMNPNSRHKSLPVVVNIYQLKGREAFNSSSFQQLWKNPQAALGSDLINHNTVHISPGQSKTITIERKPETQYIAALAVLRHPASHDWRSATHLTQWSVPYLPQHVQVDVINNRIYVK